MSNTLVVLGMQWGDEGKGKIVDLLATESQAIVRYQGGHNAGHTIYLGDSDKKIVLQLIPSGILHKHTQCYIGNGVVVSPWILCKEMDMLASNGIYVDDRLWLSNACHVLMPYHISLDQVREKSRGKSAIGTTVRGIGPAYEDKVARRGIRIADLFDEKQLKTKLELNLDYHNFVLRKYHNVDGVELNNVMDDLLVIKDRIQKICTDVTSKLYKHYQNKDKIIFEAAQGTMLDIDHGTYPYVTSSNTTVGSAASGSGLGTRFIDEVLGITKAYTTRVGSGSFVTELFDDVGDYLAKTGQEFGSNTKRPRRCGWLDLVALKRAVIVNSVSKLCVTKLDVLDQLKEIKLCTAYSYNGDLLNHYPTDNEILEKCQPIYKSFVGWQEATANMNKLENLPQLAREYLQYIEDYIGVSIALISTGVKRNDGIFITDFFE